MSPTPLETIEGLSAVIWLRRSVWGYAAVNGLHIFGIALLIGSVVNVDLRLLGIWRGQQWREGLRDILPIARLGFGVAIVTGLMLWSVRAGRYLENPAFLLKMALLCAAMLNIALFHRVFQEAERNRAMRLSALISICVWAAILASGRAIGFI